MTFTYTVRSVESWAERAAQKFEGEVSPTAVQKFLQPAFVEKRRAYVACVNCGHWRCMHCTKRKLKPGLSPTHAVWKGFVNDGGQIQPCSHTLPDAQPYICTSTACATRMGRGEDEHYCPCKKFVSPFAKKRAVKPREVKRSEGDFRSLIPREDLERAHQIYLAEQEVQRTPKTNTRAEILVEVVREDPTLTVAQLVEAAERSPSWVRKNLRSAGLIPPAKTRRACAEKARENL